MLALEDLQVTLRGALEIIRAQGEAADDRLLLCAWFWLKRVHDEFEERYEAIVREETAAGRSAEEAHALAQDPDEYRFFLPPQAKWAALAADEGRCGENFLAACLALERNHPSLLAGVFGQLRPAFPAAAQEFARFENLCQRLWDLFDKKDLSDSNLLSREIIGAAATYLISGPADTAGRKSDFASPPRLMQLLAELLQPQPGMRICDPTCGAGGGLVACAQYLQQCGHNPQNLSLFGQEIDPAIWALAKLHLLLHDLPDHQIWPGHALTSPILDGEELMKFDLVLAHLPFSLPGWGYQEAGQDPWHRFEGGMPPQKRGDLAFVLHAWATLNERGRAALVVPQGVLFRGGAEAQIRRLLLQKEVDAIEAVISLPPGWLYDAKLPAAVLLLNRAKPPERKGRVLFIDAGAFPHSLLHGAGNASLVPAIAAIFHHSEQNKLADLVGEELERKQAAVQSRHLRLREIWRHNKQGQALAQKEAQESMQQLERVQAGLKNWLAHPAAFRSFSWASLDEITGSPHAYLTPSRYCAEQNAIAMLDLEPELQALQALEAERHHAEAEMDRLLLEFGKLAAS